MIRVGQDWRHSIVLADIDTLTTTVLIEKDDRQLRTVAWPNPDQVQLTNARGKEWEMDVATGSTATGE